MSSKSTTPRGLRETQIPPNHGDVWTYDEPSDLWKPKPGGGGVPAQFGIGAVTEIFGFALTNGILLNPVSLDPDDTDHVSQYWLAGIGLNNAKNAYVIQTAGLYEITTTVRIPQHATAWMSIGGYDSNGVSGLAVAPAYPPLSIANMVSLVSSSYVDWRNCDVGRAISFAVVVHGADAVLDDGYCRLRYMGPQTGPDLG